MEHRRAFRNLSPSFQWSRSPRPLRPASPANPSNLVPLAPALRAPTLLLATRHFDMEVARASHTLAAESGVSISEHRIPAMYPDFSHREPYVQHPYAHDKIGSDSDSGNHNESHTIGSIYDDHHERDAPTLAPRRSRKQPLLPAPRDKPVCVLCGDRFSRPQGLRRHHITVHTTEKRFECDRCGKRFSRRDGLLRHVRIHNNFVLSLGREMEARDRMLLQAAAAAGEFSALTASFAGMKTAVQ